MKCSAHIYLDCIVPQIQDMKTSSRFKAKANGLYHVFPPDKAAFSNKDTYMELGWKKRKNDIVNLQRVIMVTIIFIEWLVKIQGRN